MTLIKNNQDTIPIRDTVVLDFSDLNGHAKRVIEESKSESQRINNEASEHGYREGYERGLAEGRERGEQDGCEQAHAARTAEIDQLLNGWQSAMAKWHSDRESLYEIAGDEIVQMAYLLIHKVICRAVQIDSSIIRDQLDEALSLLKQTAVLEIVINPADRSVAQDALPEFLSSIGASRHVKLRDDPELMRGGCVIRTTAGKVNASIESQLDCIADAIMPRPAAYDQSDTQ